MPAFAAADALAYGVLAAAAAGGAAWVVYRFRTSPFRPAQTVLWGITVFLTRVLWRTRVVGRMPLPHGAGAVIVANHRSSIDPLFIGMATRALVHWMVAREYCEHPAFRWALKNCEVIPTSRGGVDTAATKQAIRLAVGGRWVGVFPEGRINDSSAILLPGRPGAALIALKARVPIVPCFIEGSPYDGTAWGAMLMPARVRLLFGPPLDLSPYYDREPSRELLEDITRQAMRAVARLAGQPEFEPQLAGRFYKPAE
jgi:1-acyl-sn-glycerol-3-phosphate acyltransferase